MNGNNDETLHKEFLAEPDDFYSIDIESFVERRKLELTESEINQIYRLAAYLRKVDRAYEDSDPVENKNNDLVQFVNQYSARRNIKLEDYFPTEFIQWFDELQIKVKNNG